ncbi:MAG: hypothetical protein IKA79_05135 [Lentisphaeria bacterium]|nr:hypothetical protein [Lentisphaeria bacterium]
MNKICLFSCFLSLSFAFFLSSCVTQNDPLLDDVPEFEVRNLSFIPGRKITQKKELEKTFLMRWNILGPVEPAAGKDVTHPVLEEEGLLCGSVEAPDDAYWHVRIFNSRARKDRQTGLCNWTKTLSGYTKKSLFYGCNTLLAEKEYKNVTLHLLTAGEVQLFLNGKNKGTFLQPNLPGTNEYLIKGLILKKGANRLVLKYLDKTSAPALRAVAVRFSIPEKEGEEKKISLIR